MSQGVFSSTVLLKASSLEFTDKFQDPSLIHPRGAELSARAMNKIDTFTFRSESHECRKKRAGPPVIAYLLQFYTPMLCTCAAALRVARGVGKIRVTFF